MCEFSGLRKKKNGLDNQLDFFSYEKEEGLSDFPRVQIVPKGAKTKYFQDFIGMFGTFSKSLGELAESQETNQ